MAFKYNPLSGQIEDQQQGPQGPAGTMTSSAGGTASTPGFNFSGDTDTGLYSAGVNELGIATGGAGRLFINNTGQVTVGPAESTLDVNFHIHSAISGNGPILNLTNDTGDCRIFFGKNDSTFSYNAYGQIRYNVANNDLKIYTNGSPRFTIDSSGKVGIGTTSPNALFTVKGASNGQLEFQPDNENSVNKILSINRVANAYREIHYDASSHNFEISGTSKLELTSTGNVLVKGGKVSIGEATAHTYNAHVAVDDLVVGGGSSHGITVLTGNTSTGSLWFDAQDATRGYIQYAHNEQALILGTEGNERLRINSTGQLVTNGSATPYATRSATFQPPSGQTNSYVSIVAGNTTSVSGLTFGDANDAAGNYAGMFEYLHSDDSLRYKQNNSEKFCILANGNVGIGTSLSTTPSSILSVEPLNTSSGRNISLYTKGSTGNKAGIFFNATQGTGNLAEIQAEYTGTNQGKLSFNTSMSPRMLIDASGNVGIGTSTPDTLLHISQANVGAPQNAGSGLMIEHSTSADLQFMSGGGGYNHIFFGDADDANIGLIRYNHAGNANSMDFITNASAAPNLQIASSGKVSIGDAATHTYSAHTEGDDLVIGGAGWRGMTIYGTNGGVIQFADDAGNRDGQIIYDHGNRSMHFRSAGNVDRLKIDSSGNVGIGTNGPNRLLHIAGSGTANLIRVGRTDSSSHGSHDVQVQFAENHYHNLKVGAETYSLSTRSTANALFINDAGNVGIGTTSPTHKLEVNGTSRFNNYIEFGGTVSTPSTAAAIYRPADNSLAFSTANTQRLLLDSYGAATFQGDINIGAEKYLKFGGTALQIRRSSGNNYINSGSGSLYLQAGGSSAFEISSIGDITFFGNSSKDVIWDKSEGLLRLKDNAKLEFGTDADTQIWHDDSELSIYNGTGTIRTRSDSLLVRNKANNASLLECYSDRAEFPGDIKLAATKGIQFGTTAGANHTLDDYEEGNHNPTDESDVSPALSFTYNNIGIYTKIGGFVHFSFDITFPSSISTAKGAEHAKISAPYLAQQDNHGGGCVGFTDIGKAVLLHVNTSGVFLREDGGSNLTNAQCAGKRFIGQVVFRAT